MTKKKAHETYEMDVLLTGYRLMGSSVLPSLMGAEITAVTTAPVEREKLSRAMFGRPLRVRLIVDLAPEKAPTVNRKRLQ